MLQAGAVNRSPLPLDALAADPLHGPAAALLYSPRWLPPFVRENVRAMHGYSPGEQPSPGERVIKLNTNENPFPPSPKVMAGDPRRSNRRLLRRYPQPMADDFRHAAAKVLGVSRGHDPRRQRQRRHPDHRHPHVRAARRHAGVPAPDVFALRHAGGHRRTRKSSPCRGSTGGPCRPTRSMATRCERDLPRQPERPVSGSVGAARRRRRRLGRSKFSGLLLVDEAYVDFADDRLPGPRAPQTRERGRQPFAQQERTRWRACGSASPSVSGPR